MAKRVTGRVARLGVRTRGCNELVVVARQVVRWMVGQGGRVVAAEGVAGRGGEVAGRMVKQEVTLAGGRPLARGVAERAARWTISGIIGLRHERQPTVDVQRWIASV